MVDFFNGSLCSMRDDELATPLNMTIKDLQKACGKLKMSGMIKVYFIVLVICYTFN